MGYGLKQRTSALLVPLAAVIRRASKPLRRLWNHARLRESLGTAIDPSIVVLGLPEIHGSARIRLGRELFLYPGLYLETQGSGTISIGDGVVLSRGVHLVAFDGIEIGAGSMIGEYTSIRDANHRTDVIGDVGTLRHSGHDSRAIRIGREVWIGRGVAVLAGVQIGDGAVIGANAVVTHDIPARSVAAGVPARVLRSLDPAGVTEAD